MEGGRETSNYSSAPLDKRVRFDPSFCFLYLGSTVDQRAVLNPQDLPRSFQFQKQKLMISQRHHRLHNLSISRTLVRHYRVKIANKNQRDRQNMSAASARHSRRRRAHSDAN